MQLIVILLLALGVAWVITNYGYDEPISLAAGNVVKEISKLSEEFRVNLNSCPQIDVPMDSDNRISGTTKDGWTIHGNPVCKKGDSEGENLNNYYCGGFGSNFMGSTVNAYVEKTFISDSGDIGETKKIILWNTYDGDKNFISTKCLGDPDKFEEQQFDSMIDEFKSWG